MKLFSKIGLLNNRRNSIPAKMGIQNLCEEWIPACTAMTVKLILIRSLAVILCLLFLQAGLKSQSKGFISDNAAFRFNEDKLIWEFYYSFPDNLLSYRKEDGKYHGELQIALQIESSLKVEHSESWVVSNIVDSIVDSYKMDLVGLKSYVLSPGQYNVLLTAQDMANNSIKFSKEFDLIIRPISKSGIDISGIEFARLIEKKNEQSNKWNEMFYKNTLYVIPNPSAEIEGDDPALSIYFEIYNAKSFSPDGIEVKYTISDGARRKVFEFKKQRNSINDGLVERASLPLESLPSGVYYAGITVIYNNNEIKDSVSKSKKFYLYNYGVPARLRTPYTESELFQMSEFATMSPKRVEIEFLQFKYLLTNPEIEEFELLTTNKGRQRALFKYWAARDIDSLNFVNEARQKFIATVKYANTYFRYGQQREGWRTDRGRTLLKYGFPTTTDRYQSKLDKNATEVWFYNSVYGGSYFFFVDKTGIGDYQLVHSTAPIGVYNPNWIEEYNSAINQNEYPQGSGNSRRGSNR